MILNDKQLRQLCQQEGLVDPYDDALINPASIDLRLGGQVRFPKHEWRTLLIAHGQQVRIATGWIADDTTISATGKLYEKPWYNRPQNHVVASRTTDSNQLQRTPPPNTAKVAETGGGSAKPVASQPAVSFPITRRELTDDEVAEVMRLSADGASKNKLCFTVYGQKDGMTMGFINNALARGVTAGC